MTIIPIAKGSIAAYIPAWVRDRMDLQPRQRITWTVSEDGRSATFTIHPKQEPDP